MAVTDPSPRPIHAVMRPPTRTLVAQKLQPHQSRRTRWPHLDLSIDDSTPQRLQFFQVPVCKRRRKQTDEDEWPERFANRYVRRDPQPVDREQTPDPLLWSRAIALATLEALIRLRPLGQLERWVSPEVYATLERRLELAHRLNEFTGRLRRPKVINSRLCHPREGVVETIHVIGDEDRVRAIGVRLEHHRKQWLVTAVEVL